MPWWTSAALAAMALVLPPIAVGDRTVAELRPGEGRVGLSAAAVPVNCSAGNVVCMTGNATSRIDVTTSNMIFDGRGFSSVGITVYPGQPPRPGLPQVDR
ncbi:hypothetical protein [Pseudonocardia hierapolitana]|uniref:hypothetical protein n=1 Tax=Pseudonocardia hierapolitana TaxID=1128676 RepID=UPI0011BE3925|nr:hypothetical protein [Pseudonocardia hierapolitana]